MESIFLRGEGSDNSYPSIKSGNGSLKALRSYVGLSRGPERGLKTVNKYNIFCIVLVTHNICPKINNNKATIKITWLGKRYWYCVK